MGLSRVIVVGDLASGVADDGSQGVVPVGGVVSTTAPGADVTGKRKVIWIGQNGVQVVSPVGVTQATDLANNYGLALDAAGGVRPIAVGILGWDGAAGQRYRIANVFKTLNAVVITSETTIWTPAGGKKFRLMGMYITQGVATGAITLKDNTAGTTIAIIPPNTVGVAMPLILFGNNGLLSAAANNVLTATGASTETITGYVFGTEE